MAKASGHSGHRGLPVAPPLPLTIRLRICLESVVSFPTGVGAEPGRKKWISWIFYFRKKPSETPLSVILSGGGAPKRRGARETPPFPVSTGLSSAVSETSHVSYGDSHLFHRLPYSCFGRNSRVLAVFYGSAKG